LYETAGAATTRFVYAGAELVGEYNTSGTLLRRYVPGPGLDDAAAWYEGAGASDRRWLIADERGSVIGWANGSGASGGAYAYDEYGQPNVWTGARLRFAGAMALPEAQLYHMRARAYAPALGRFLQADPILTAGVELVELKLQRRARMTRIEANHGQLAATQPQRQPGGEPTGLQADPSLARDRSKPWRSRPGSSRWRRARPMRPFRRGRRCGLGQATRRGPHSAEACWSPSRLARAPILSGPRSRAQAPQLGHVPRKVDAPAGGVDHGAKEGKAETSSLQLASLA
jgi:RHS repeat-associated protein